VAALGDPHITEMLLTSFVLVLFIGSLFSLAVGAGLLLRSDALLRFFAVMNRWVSTRLALKPLEVPRSIESSLTPSKRRWIGIIFIVAGTYAVLVLTLKVDVPKVVWLLSVSGPQAGLAAILIDTLRWFLVTGCAAGVLLGVLLLAFPATWAALERRANYWYSTRQLASGGDTMRMTLDGWVARYPRLAGAIILALSIIPALASGVMLFSRS